jgi:hypothetical protein
MVLVMGTNFELENPKSVVFKPGRWSVFINAVSAEGIEETWVASADSFLTEGSGIFFGTKKEYEARMNGEDVEDALF